MNSISAGATASNRRCQYFARRFEPLYTRPVMRMRPDGSTKR